MMDEPGSTFVSTVTVANLWAKQLLVGDLIIAADPVQSRYGELRMYTVERLKAVHDAEKERIAEEKRRDLEQGTH